MSEQCDNI